MVLAFIVQLLSTNRPAARPAPATFADRVSTHRSAPACLSLEHDFSMALSDPRVASVVTDGIVGWAPASKEVVLEIKLLNFINEFLFTQTEECAHVVIPRHIFTRSRRYRSIWRSAARSITRHYSSDSESNESQCADIGWVTTKTHGKAAVPVVRSTPDLQGIAFPSTDRDCRTTNCKPDIESGGTDLDSKQGVHASGDAGEALLTKSTVSKSCNRSQPTGSLKQQIECEAVISSHPNRGDLLSQVRQDTCAHAMEPFTPVCTVNIDREFEGQAIVQCPQVAGIAIDRKVSHTLSGVQVHETVPASFGKETMKPSSKKPPRPPRPNMSHPNSCQTSQVRRAKRPRFENRIAKRRKSGFNTPSLLALIVTLCFAAIIVVQGFLGNSSVRGANFKAEGAPEAQRAFLTLPGDRLKLSPDQETQSHTSSGIHATTGESRLGSSLVFVDQLHKNQPEVPLSASKLQSSEVLETIKHSD